MNSLKSFYAEKLGDPNRTRQIAQELEMALEARNRRDAERAPPAAKIETISVSELPEAAPAKALAGEKDQDEEKNLPPLDRNADVATRLHALERRVQLRKPGPKRDRDAYDLAMLLLSRAGNDPSDSERAKDLELEKLDAESDAFAKTRGQLSAEDQKNWVDDFVKRRQAVWEQMQIARTQQRYQLGMPVLERVSGLAEELPDSFFFPIQINVITSYLQQFHSLDSRFNEQVEEAAFSHCGRLVHRASKQVHPGDRAVWLAQLSEFIRTYGGEAVGSRRDRKTRDILAQAGSEAAREPDGGRQSQAALIVANMYTKLFQQSKKKEDLGQIVHYLGMSFRAGNACDRKADACVTPRPFVEGSMTSEVTHAIANVDFDQAWALFTLLEDPFVRNRAKTSFLAGVIQLPR